MTFARHRIFMYLEFVLPYYELKKNTDKINLWKLKGHCCANNAPNLFVYDLDKYIQVDKLRTVSGS